MSVKKMIIKSFAALSFLCCVTLTAVGETFSPMNPSQGSGTAESPYQISTPEHLAWMAVMVNGGNHLSDLYFIQVNDIDLAETKNLNGGEGWMPIGGYFMIGGVRTKTGFKGHYDGQGYSIRNLYINRPGGEYQALFGYVARGSVHNLTLLDASVAGLENVAVAFAYTFESRIENCHVKNSEIDCRAFYAGGLIGFQAWGHTEHSSADVTLSGRDYIGGLIGWCEEGAVIGCHAQGQVLGTVFNGIQPRHCGGLVGFCNKSTVERASCTTSLIEGGEWTGGLFGSLEHSKVSESVSRCGKVVGVSYVGGIAGRTNESTIRNCYTSSAVEGDQNVGGVSGFFTYSTSLLDCVYSIGQVTAASVSSMFVGAVLGGYGTGTIKNVIYDKTVNPTLPGIAGPNGGDSDVKPRSPEEMRQEDSYPNWDFNKTWLLSSSYNNGLPILRWEIDPLWSGLSDLGVEEPSLMLSCRGDMIYITTSPEVELVSIYGLDGIALPFMPVAEGEYALSFRMSPPILILVYRCKGKLQVTKRIL